MKTFDDKLKQTLAWGDGTSWKATYLVNVWRPPAVGDSTWIGKQSLTWDEAETHAEAWMQVRHCLTHGLARGFRREVWPGPLRGTISADSVLRPNSSGKHSLSIHGAESCAHIYRSSAQRLADEAITFLGHDALDWSKVPDFSL